VEKRQYQSQYHAMKCSTKLSALLRPYGSKEMKCISGMTQMGGRWGTCWQVFGVPKIASDPHHFWRKSIGGKGLAARTQSSVLGQSNCKDFSPQTNADQRRFFGR